MAGTPAAILRWLDAVEAHAAYAPGFTNQALFNILRFIGTPLAPIDDRTELFYVLYGEVNELQFQQGIPVNSVYGTRPNFLHAAGGYDIRPIMDRRRRSLGEEPSRTLVSIPVEEVKLRGGALPNRATKPIPIPEPEWEPTGSASWSKMPNTVAICVPFAGRNPDGSLRWVPPEFSMAMGLLQVPPNVQCIWLATKGVKRDEARCDLVRKAREAKARYVMFCDDDNPPPPNALLNLMYVMDASGDDVALCGGIYASKTDPPLPLVYQAEGAGPYWRWRAGEVFECPGGIATGCMMIRTSAFDHIPEPWFMDTPERTDDMYFCAKVREAGMRMLAHGGVLPAHWGQDGIEYRLPPDSYPFRGSVIRKEAEDADAEDGQVVEPVLSQ
jgi:hypothetical protein